LEPTPPVGGVGGGVPDCQWPPFFFFFSHPSFVTNLVSLPCSRKIMRFIGVIFLTFWFCVFHGVVSFPPTLGPSLPFIITFWRLFYFLPHRSTREPCLARCFFLARFTEFPFHLGLILLTLVFLVILKKSPPSIRTFFASPGNCQFHFFSSGFFFPSSLHLTPLFVFHGSCFLLSIFRVRAIPLPLMAVLT